MLSQMYISLRGKYRYFCQILIKLQISCRNIQIQNFMKIRPVAAEMFHAGRRTDMAQPRVDFRLCANAPKNIIYILRPGQRFTNFLFQPADRLDAMVLSVDPIMEVGSIYSTNWNGMYIVSLRLPSVEVSISHSDTRHSIGLLCSSDQPLIRERHPRPRRDSNPQSQQASGRRPTP